ncbi:MAG TPA: hypothetical protein VK985_04735 [Rariglobus sp.]|nr:hypothetical protein [Rariglobus sp.]
MHPFSRRFAAVILSVIASASLVTRAADLSAHYEFKPVKLGGGGFVTGIQLHPSAGGPVYCRTDVGGLYRWNEVSASWTQLMIASALPPEVIAAEAVNTGDGLPGSGSHRKRLYHVESIAIDPSNPAVLFVATGSVLDQPGTLLKSTDGGRSFKLMNLAVPMAGNAPYPLRVHGERLAVHPANSKIVLFGSRSEGLWRSVNGGLDWSRVDSVPTGPVAKKSVPVGVGPVVFDAANPGRAYLSVSKVGSFRSDDSGATWSQIGAEWADDLVISKGVVYLCRAGLGVQRYLPASGWLTVNPSGDKQVNNLAVDPVNPKRVFALHQGGKNIYRTLDGGDTWTKLVSGSTEKGRALFRSRDIPWLENGDSHTWLSVGEFSIDPHNPARLWFAEGMALYRSNDATDDNDAPSFDNISDGMEEFVASDVLATPGGKVTFLVWDRVGFNRTHATLDSAPEHQIGLSQKFGTGVSLAASGLNPRFVVASVADMRLPPLNGGYDGFGVTSGTSADGGETWSLFGSVDPKTEANTPETLMFGEIVVSATDTRNLVWLPRWPSWFIRGGKAVSNGGDNDQFIYSSIDGGVSWQPAAIGDYKEFRREYMVVKRSLVADPVVGGKFYAYDQQGRIFVSTDKGAAWTVANAGSALPVYGYTNVLRASPARSGHLWFVSGWDYRGGNSEGLYRSTDGGANWLKLDGFSATWHIGFGRAERDKDYPAIYVYGKYNGAWGLYRSTDEAKTWDLLSAFPLGLVDHVTALNGDPDLFGRVYLGYAGNGFAYGTPRGAVSRTAKPAPAVVPFAPVVRPAPPAASVTPAAAAPATSDAATPAAPRYDFETGTQGWENAWKDPVIGAVAISADRAVTGKNSLRVEINNTMPTVETINVLVQSPAGIKPGDVVKFNYWITEEKGIFYISPFVMGSGVKWKNNQIDPVAGRWSTVSLEIPQEIGTIGSLGFQLIVEPGVKGAVYLDAIE